MNRNNMLKNSIVFGVILLFLGVGFQPALSNEISTNPVSVDEDCFECQPVNRVDLLKVKLLLIRVEAFTNIILSRFSHIQEIREKCEEASERISEISELNENVFVCNFLFIAVIFIVAIVELTDMILNPFEQGSPIFILIGTLLSPWYLFLFSISFTIIGYMAYFECDLFYP